MPICVQVMNTNAMHTASVGLVGYLPYVEVSEGYKQHKDCVAARRHVLQVCQFSSVCTWVHIYVHSGGS